MTNTTINDPQPPAAVAPRSAEPTLAERVEEQAGEIRRLRRLTSLMLMALAILLGLAGALTFVASRHGFPGTTAEVVAAEQFIVRDAGGTVRGAWGIADDGSVRIQLNDPTGKARVRLASLEDGSAGLSFPDSTSRGRVVLGVLPDETTTLVLADRRGQPRAVLGVTPDGSSTLVFADRGGATKAGIGVDARGFGTFSVADQPDGRGDDGAAFEEDSAGASQTTEPAPTPPQRRR